MMPSSRKGRDREVTCKPIPIPPSSTARLLALAKGRSPDAPLLRIPSGEPWYDGAHFRPFQDAVAAAGCDASRVTYYALRHTFITTRLLAGIRLLADAVDSSVAMLERTYISDIADDGEALLRKRILDLSPRPAAKNKVVRHPRAKAGLPRAA